MNKDCCIPLLSIAIITYNRSKLLKETLEVIESEVIGIDEKIEIVISDNASTDDTKDVVESFKNLKISYYKNDVNCGASENVIKVCERVKGKYVLLHSDDDLLLKGAIFLIIKTIKLYKNAGTISSPLLTFDEFDSSLLFDTIRFPGFGKDMYLKSGYEALSSLFLRACSLSGLIIKNEYIDLNFAKEHVACNYPQLAIFAKACSISDAVYLEKPIMKIRQDRVKRWNYSEDFMSRALFNILYILTEGKDFGEKTRKLIIQKRVYASYAPLFNSRNNSMRDFIAVVKKFVRMKEYRYNYIFWMFVIALFIFGSNNITKIKKIWRGKKGDSI